MGNLHNIFCENYWNLTIFYTIFGAAGAGGSTGAVQKEGGAAARGRARGKDEGGTGWA